MKTKKEPAFPNPNESQKLYQDLVETSQDLIWQCDEQGRYTYLNPAWETVFGYTVEEMIGRKFTEFQPPEIGRRDMDEFARLMKGESVKGYETIHIGKEGNTINLVFNAKAVRDEKGTITGTRGTAHDITGYKQAEKSLLEIKENFRILFDNNPQPILLSEFPSGRIAYANKQFVDSLVMNEKDIIGKTANELGLLSNPADQEKLTGLIASQGYVDNIEISKVFSDGRHGTDLVSMRLVTINAKQYCLIVLQDITGWKLIDETLHKTAGRYRALVETTDTGYVIIEKSGIVLDANAEYVRLSGHTRLEEIKGRKVLEWTADEDLSRNRDAVEECMKTGRVRGLEISYVDKLGHRTPVEINATVVETDGAMQILSLCRDITGRKQAEYQKKAALKSLRISEDTIRTISNNLSHGMIYQVVRLNDGSRKFTYLSDSVRWLYGVSPEEAMADAMCIYGRVHEQDRERVFREEEEANRTLSTFRTEVRMLDPSGKIRWSLFVSTPRLSEDGSTIWDGIEFDITDRKMAESERETVLDALRRSETMYRSIIDSSPMGMHLYELKPDDRLIFVGSNPAANKILGVDNSGFIGKTIEEAFPTLASTEIPSRYREVAKTGEMWQTEQIDYADDRIRGAFHVVAFRIAENSMAAMFLDITENRQAQEALSAEKERLSVTLRSIGDGVITTDTRGTVVIMNKVAEKLTGWLQAEAQNKPLSTVFNIINESTRKPCENPVAKVIASGEIIELANHTLLISRDGTERVIADSGAPIKDKTNKTIGVVLVFRDTTEKQKLLETSYKNQKLESLGILAGGIAHDFNNLLGGIYGYIEISRLKARESEVVRTLEATLATMNRAKALTHQLLTFSKGGTPVQKIGPLFPFVQETAQFALSGSNVLCNYSVIENLWLCNFDLYQIGQVIDNIVINAQQSMPLGGTIEISAKNVSFRDGEHATLVAGNYVGISIKDSGIGIAREILPSIFDPFFTTKAKGHGLGLATCYSIVKRHGGAIDVESDQGKGSTFTIYLPASSEVASLTARKAYISHKGSGRVMVIDDEEVVRNVIAAMLKSLGYTVVLKNDGKDGIAFFREEQKAARPIRAIIVDLTIPGGMGGIETVTEIRKIDPDIAVFVSSGYAENSVIARPRDFGFTASISKPFSIAELAHMLDEYCRE